MATCPNGHQSASTDYCDVCGAPMAAQAPAAPAGGQPSAAPAAEFKACPSCQAVNPPDALFCEACGYDFTTGTMPRTAAETASILDLDAPVSDVPMVTQTTDSPLGDPLATAEPRDRDAAAEVDKPGPHEPAAEEHFPAAAPAPQAPAAPAQPGEDAVPAPDAPQIGTDGPSSDVAAPVAADADVPPTPLPDELPEPGVPAVEAPAPASDEFEWVAEVWIDPDWYAVQQAEDRMPSPGLPEIVPLRKKTILIGRESRSRGITPEIDCHTDNSCSRRQAQLTTDGQRWWVEDLDSANGTYVGAAGSPLPEHPIPRGRVELGEDDRVYVGAWTRIVLRRATPDERATLA